MQRGAHGVPNGAARTRSLPHPSATWDGRIEEARVTCGAPGRVARRIRKSAGWTFRSSEIAALLRAEAVRRAKSVALHYVGSVH
jgi:hypothetical protein